jgi:DNA polymerase-1
MLAEWMINPDSRNLGLKKLAWVRLNREMKDIQDLIGKGKSQITMAQVPIKDAALYAVDDAVMTYQLKGILKEELKDSRMDALYHELEIPLIPVLAQMEQNGISLDIEFLREMSIRLENELVSLEGKIYKRVGKEFNLNSPQQLSEALFETLKLNPPDRTRRTKSGYYSTAADVLEELSKTHEVPRWVLDYRELAKLKSTYVDALVEQVHARTGRVHTSYNQAGTVTGRIASSEPNLQNIPIRTEVGRQVRKAFIARQGWLLAAVDYSQIELRVVAHMARDQAMIKAFQAGQDIHAITAAAIYDLPLDEVSKEQRRHAKAINFGLIYGMSPYGLTQTTDLTLAEAEDFVKAYFTRFPGVKKYLDNMRKQAREEGFVETMMGRKRFFPHLSTASNVNVQRREEREAINAPIQGTAADIMKKAMIEVDRMLSQKNLQSKILLQVHDELVLETPRGEISRTIPLVKSAMEGVAELDVPLVTEARVGQNWGEMDLYEG